MTVRNKLCWLIPLLLIVTFPLWKIPVGKFLAPRGGIDPSMSKEEEKISQNFAMENSVIKQFKDDQLVAVVRSATAKSGESKNDFQLTDIEADIFDEDQNATHIIARKGNYSSKQELLILKENVVVHKKSEGQKLFTEHLRYDGAKQLVDSPVKTRIVTKDAEIEGGTFTYDIQEGRYEFDKKVNVVLNGVNPVKKNNS